MENTQGQDGHSASGDDMMFDPEVMDLMNELDLVRRTTNAPMTVAEQAQVLGQIIVEKQARKRSIQSQFDDDEAIAEAAGAMKRRRIHSNADLSGANKIYACGPEQQPDMSDGNGADALDDLMFDHQLLGLSANFSGTHSDELQGLRSAPGVSDTDLVPTYKPGFNLLESVCSSVWLAVEVAKHLGVSDIVNLYSTSKTFHGLLDEHWQSSIFAWAEHMAPSSFRIFYWKFYGCYARTDPSGTTWEARGLFADAFPRPPWAKSRPVTAADKNVRSVPGLRYLAMLVKREVRVRDILAALARRGHRLPGSCHQAVKKMWMLMDLPTNTLRRAFIRSTELWTPEDIYNAQMFVTKLQMRFNEPIFGPDAPLAVDTILGARQGLTPLWQILRGKNYTELLEAIQMRVRYLAGPHTISRSHAWVRYNVPRWQLGRGHLEGWGQGHIHLSRPDELVVEEAARRGINLKDHLTYMAFWGHVDWRNRANLVPTEEEMYMSDDELPPLAAHDKGPDGMFGHCGNVPFDYAEWTPKHALMAKWDTLAEKEKLALREHVGRDETKLMAHEDDEEGFWNLNESEMSRLNHDKKKNTAVTATNYFYDSEDDGQTKTKAEEHKHDGNCACAECKAWALGSDTDSHDGSCICDECLDQADYDAEEEDELPEQAGFLDPNEDSDDEQDGFAHEADLAINPTSPMPPEIMLDPELRAAWNGLRPENRQNVNIIRKTQLLKESVKAALAAIAAAEVQPCGTPRSFPNVTDPVSLALLHKLDGVENKPAGGESDAGSHVSGDAEMEDEGYDDDDEIPDVDIGDDESDDGEEGGEENDDDDDAASDSSMDDEKLKALADVDYSDDELEFNMGSFQALLTRGRDDGSYRYRAGRGGDDDDDDEDAFGVAHEADLKSPGLAAEMRLPDTINY